MDFLKSMIGSLAEAEGSDDDNSEVFNHAIAVSNKVGKELIAQSRRYSADNDYFKASLFLFTAVWALAGHIYSGVHETNKKKGADNLVNKLWQLLRVAFMSGDLDQTMGKLGTFEEDFDGGKFND